jgi:hypothetical protein
MNRQISEETQMANNHMKKCSTFLAKNEIQIETTLIFHITTFKIAIIQKPNKYW